MRTLLAVLILALTASTALADQVVCYQGDNRASLVTDGETGTFQLWETGSPPTTYNITRYPWPGISVYTGDGGIVITLWETELGTKYVWSSSSAGNYLCRDI